MLLTLTFLALAVFLTQPFSLGSTLFSITLTVHIEMTWYSRSLGCKPVNSKQWNVKSLSWFPLKLTRQLQACGLWSPEASIPPQKRWKTQQLDWKERQPERERNWKRQKEKETLISVSLKRTSGGFMALTQTSLLPARVGPISADESRSLFEVVP